MAKKIIGLTAVKFGPTASDGGMGTVLESIGETVVGTMQLTQEDNQTTNFNIEESDQPIESFVSEVGAVQLAWSSYNLSYYMLKKLFGGTGNPKISAGSLNALGALTGGSGYVAGFYEKVGLTGGGGSGALANITVNGGGVVTSVEIVDPGAGYTAGSPVTTANANLGGTGTSFSQAVTSVHATAVKEKWNAPAAFSDLTGSLQVTDKKGNVTSLVRVNVSPKLGLSFTKDALGKMDFVATLLAPVKPNEPPMSIEFAN